VAEVLGKVHRGHPALAELAPDAVAAVQRGVEACYGLSDTVPLPSATKIGARGHKGIPSSEFQTIFSTL
jgi:hypothetical protein